MTKIDCPKVVCKHMQRKILKSGGITRGGCVDLRIIDHRWITDGADWGITQMLVDQIHCSISSRSLIAWGKYRSRM